MSTDFFLFYPAFFLLKTQLKKCRSYVKKRPPKKAVSLILIPGNNPSVLHIRGGIQRILGHGDGADVVEALHLHGHLFHRFFPFLSIFSRFFSFSPTRHPNCEAYARFFVRFAHLYSYYIMRIKLCQCSAQNALTQNTSPGRAPVPPEKSGPGDNSRSRHPWADQR